MNDQRDLARFIEAQDADDTYGRALTELRRGRKTSHWMWFVFPQIAGLGTSPTAVRYAIADAAEARAYLAHPVLGARLVECSDALLGLPGTDPVAVLGDIDARKLQSSMTLFRSVGTDEPAFNFVLERYFGGRKDGATTAILGR